MVIGLYTARVVLNALGIEDYGIYNVVGGIVILFTCISNSMTAATQRFITFEIGRNDTEQLNKIFSTSVLIHIIIACVVLLFIETLGYWFFTNKMQIPLDRMNAAKWVFHIAVISLFLNIINVPNNAMIIAYERMKAFAYISMFDAVIKLLIAVLLGYIFVDRLIIYAIFMMGLALAQNILYLIYVKKKIHQIFFKPLYEKRLFRKMLNFASLSFIGDLGMISYTQGLNVLLNVFFSPSVNAARGIAVQVQNAVTAFSSNFQIALNPQITKSYASTNLAYMRQLIFASSKYSFFLLFLISLPILIETKQLLFLWLKVVPEHTVAFLILVLFITIIIIIGNPLTIAAHATGKIKKYQILVGGINFFILPLSYFTLKLKAIPEYVFIINLCMVFLCLFIRVYIVKSMISFSMRDYLRDVLSPIIIVMLTSSILPLTVYHIMDDSMFRFFAVGFISLLMNIISIYHWGLNSKEKKNVNDRILFLYTKWKNK
jgi:O-antigen/teichoic acid export membrane protein